MVGDAARLSRRTAQQGWVHGTCRSRMWTVVAHSAPSRGAWLRPSWLGGTAGLVCQRCL